ncbi:MAG TPA: hypothetical protein VGI74_07645 [Streptosporangiaceae bacterium]
MTPDSVVDRLADAINKHNPAVQAKVIRQVHSGDETWEWEFTSEIHDGASAQQISLSVTASS